MRILHTESSCGWGGQEIRILSEAQGLIGRGHQVELLCPAEARIYSEAPRFGVPVHALPIGRKNLRGLGAMRRFLRDGRFDLVNTHSSTDSWLAVLAIRTLGLKLPLVRTRHISAAVPDNFASRWLYGRASDYIATTGEALRQQMLATLPILPERISSVPTGVDTDYFVPADAELRSARRRALGLPESGLLTGIVATLRSWKGHRFLIEAFAQYAPPEAGLLIVGDGPQREALEALVDTLELRARVFLVGNQQDVLPWLQALDVFALPSYANEGVPQSLMQAMAVGLPCVTTPVGAILELAENEVTALVVPPQEVGALGAALQRLVADADLRLRLGSAARRHVVAEHGREAMLDRMEEIFQAVSVQKA